MNKPKQYRWKCPRCDQGVLASKAPRRDDIKRYCLACSEKTGRLVERVCPALDAQRKQKAERQTAKQQRQRESLRRRRAANDRQRERYAAKRRAAREEVAGDLHEELRKIWPVALAVSPKVDPRRDLPTLTLSSRKGSECTGHAWWGGQHRIHVSVAADDDAAGALGVLAHEVAHIVHHDDEVHTRDFWITLVAIVVRAYDCELSIEDLDREPTMYKKQCAVEAAIRKTRGYA